MRRDRSKLIGWADWRWRARDGRRRASIAISSRRASDWLFFDALTAPAIALAVASNAHAVDDGVTRKQMSRPRRQPTGPIRRAGAIARGRSFGRFWLV